MSGLEAFLWGMFGGFAVELAGLYKLRSLPISEMPGQLGSRVYWGITLTMIMSGGILAFAYTRSDITFTNALLAMNIGATAPLVFGRLLDFTPEVELGRID